MYFQRYFIQIALGLPKRAKCYTIRRSAVNEGASMQMIDADVRQELVSTARAAVRASYAPYSQFRVGAALLCSDGTIIAGVNVENRSYGLTICAERTAIVSAVAAGHHSFTAIAVFSPDADYPISPCGACRQVMSEFMEADSPVLFVDAGGRIETHTVGEIFPFDALHELRDRPID
jgi:cytidine deaminase